MNKILLVCAAGMSTSMLMKRMKDYACSIGHEPVIEAHGVDVLKDVIAKYDVVLVAPQIRFKLAEIQKLAEMHGKKSDAINPLQYGAMNGEKVYQQAIDLISSK
ncbi:PTS sugar transporter subunit IIB [Enterobacter hormaechei]|mgnify:CR=1 FL=1|uniref:PTS sugar transporter subunit IIB n=1 Tax=Enterobacter hormaechei TaxID=158836 RepID=UPI0020B79A36|nr:PTS sugar transporter subunit IIB [Enterobacter hormaechei]EKS6646555.1 PTS sugar transporter subunit IIB [Enterobacter hormaechei]MCP3814614.1 PTS sugar transporter subunit IIB [Enterobacter hormaechei]MCP3823778.1 PTS sugar transporter subunit IIB [Enterobacter hormaechei]MCW4625276.1 PTS sugar transporter subunit IIB [Enterobacter hormaechei]